MIRRSTEIPDWFDLENYSAAKGFGVHEWRHELLFRVMVEAQITRRDEGTEPEAVDDELHRSMQRIQSRPIGYPGGQERARSPAARIQSSSEHSPVNELEVIDAFFIADDRRRWEQWKEACEALEGDKATPSQREMATTSYEAALKAEGIDHRPSFLTVDLWATDEHLVKAFKAWLADRRQATGPAINPRVFTDKDFQSWSRWKVLPYIDLRLWSRFSGTRIGLAALGEVLFPDESAVDTTDRIRRSTKPRAEWLMRDDIQIALDNQAKDAGL